MYHKRCIIYRVTVLIFRELVTTDNLRLPQIDKLRKTIAISQSWIRIFTITNSQDVSKA